MSERSYSRTPPSGDQLPLTDPNRLTDCGREPPCSHGSRCPRSAGHPGPPEQPAPIPSMAGNVIWNLATNSVLAAALFNAAWRVGS